ncbi:hypothetical protein JN00_0046 [Metamycoplasma subdolum]|uniref:Uncharacterized protein n=1 Tax=Metamycoplasma subdolum TaxID=92407 RepID=A0A3M0AIS1_9BACT|nr:hypothetical protein [Metamycoplasma subdolum]RMA79002.1 hypothetical protein JN00_0046 [Metamycoplasma subdolum]
MAQKQKDTRSLIYDPDEDTTSKLIKDFQIYKKNAVFIKDYSEMEIFENFKEIRWMKIIDEKLEEYVDETKKRQNKIRIKYNAYTEFENWSESPLAQTTRPLSKGVRLAIIGICTLIFIAMVLIVYTLTKWLL